MPSYNLSIKKKYVLEIILTCDMFSIAEEWYEPNFPRQMFKPISLGRLQLDPVLRSMVWDLQRPDLFFWEGRLMHDSSLCLLFRRELRLRAQLADLPEQPRQTAHLWNCHLRGGSMQSHFLQTIRWRLQSCHNWLSKLCTRLFVHLVFF